jgi:uncharacterized membrane protein YkvA (DUF1232 family)
MSQNPEDTAAPLGRDEFRDYLVFHAHKLSLHDLRVLADRLPELRKGFPEVQTPQFPHTPARLAFLADVVESFVAGHCENLPFESAAEAAFALIYLHQEMDLIPDILPEIGFQDDATMVALVLERNAPALRKFANAFGRDWAGLAVAEPDALGS